MGFQLLSNLKREPWHAGIRLLAGGAVLVAMAFGAVGAGSTVFGQMAVPTQHPEQDATTTRKSAASSASSSIDTRKGADGAQPSSQVAKEKAPLDPKAGRDWVRLEKDPRGEVIGMQTAVVRYGQAQPAAPKAAGVQVDLIGAVHIGDQAYYKKLNQLFEQYDVLLYELVAPEGTVVEKGRGTSNANPVGAMQNLAKNVLELDHQLTEIDYTKPNFVHADMSPEDFMKAMKDRNESFLQMYFRLVGHAMAQQSELAGKGGSPDLDILSALFASDRPRRLKIVFAGQLSEMESMMVSFGGENGSVIITDRNKKALEVLKKQIESGKKKIGIFYGAGHLNDMDQRLRNEFYLRPESISWLTAWDLRPR